MKLKAQVEGGVTIGGPYGDPPFQGAQNFLQSGWCTGRGGRNRQSLNFTNRLEFPPENDVQFLSRRG
ncbi:hypothetical protein STEG23_034941 [Scotinomys teguina]